MAIDTRVRTYDPKKIIITFGSDPVTGFADGTFVSIEQNGESFTKKKGADGTVDRTNMNADDYTVTVTIKQTSVTNKKFSEIHNSDKLNNDGIKPLTVKDLRGETLFSAPSAWIQTNPNVEFGDESNNRDWVFETGKADFVQDGSV